MKMGPVSEEAQRNVLKELIEEIDVLKQTIETLSRRKSICEALVRDLSTSQDNVKATTTQSVQDDDTEDDVSSESQGPEGHANDVSNPSS